MDIYIYIHIHRHILENIARLYLHIYIQIVILASIPVKKELVGMTRNRGIHFVSPQKMLGLEFA